MGVVDPATAHTAEQPPAGGPGSGKDRALGPDRGETHAASADIELVGRGRHRRRHARPRAERVLRPDGWFFAVWVTVAALYSMSLTMRFGLYDDYRNAGADDLLRFDVGDGRPLAALVHAFQFHHADRFSEFVWIRGITLVLLGLAAAALFSLLRRTSMPTLAAAALAVCAAATVSTQIIAAWGVTLVVAPVAMLLGGAGGHVTWRATERLDAKDERRLRALPAAGAGGALLVAGLCFYQPAAMAFWLAVLVAQGTETLTVVRRTVRTLWLGIVAGLAMVVYLIIWKTGAALTDRSGARGALSTDPGEKLRWFWEVALRRAFHPFSLSGAAGGRLALALALLGLVGIALGHRTGAAARLGAAVACAGCFPLAYLPNLATSESWASSRSLAVLMPMAVVLVGLGAHGVVRAVTPAVPPARGALLAAGGRPATSSWAVTMSAGASCAVLCVAAVASSLRAQSNVQRYLVVSNAVELAAYEHAVRAAAASGPAEIVLVPSEWMDTIAPGVSFDEFGYPATAATWALEPMARSAVDGTGYEGSFRVINRDDLPSVAPGSVVVDAKLVLAGIDH